jgi:hypothetical protein
LLLLWCRSLSSWRLMYSEEEEQEHRAREPTKAAATTATNFFNEAVRRWSVESGRRKIRGKQRQQQPPSPVISNAPRASPSFSPSLPLSLFLPSRARARARYSLVDLPCSLGKPLILVWGKPNRQNAIFVRF